MAGRPALLSDIPAHSELKEQVPDIVLFDPGSVESFTSGFARLEQQALDPVVRRRLQADALRAYGTEGFADNVRQVLAHLRAAGPAGG